MSRKDSQGVGQQEEHDGEIAVQEGRPKLGEPRKYAVLLHNDDYTTFDFVVEVLQKYFQKSSEEAAEITLRVHRDGKGLAGIYSYDIAETKVAQVIEYAKAHGYPLRC